MRAGYAAPVADVPDELVFSVLQDMRIAFDSRTRGDRGGIGRYAMCLPGALRGVLGGADEVLETHHPRRADVFHAPWLGAALLRTPCPMVVTLHDLRALQRSAERLRAGAHLQLRLLATRRSVRVIATTRAIAAAATDHLGLDRDRVTVIPKAPPRTMYRRRDEEVAQVRSRHRLPERYVLWVGALHAPRARQHVEALAAAARDAELVVAGPAGRWAPRELPRVHIAGAVDDDELAALYSGARALVVTSEQEAFGIPWLDAAACGTPIVARDTPALRETLLHAVPAAREHVRYVPAQDVGGLMRAAESFVGAAAPIRPWTWRDAARATVSVYESALMPSARPLPAVPRTRRGA